MARYQCPECLYVYDEERGDARQGFPPATPWARVPDDWACPDCAVRDKPDFLALLSGSADRSPGASPG